MADCAALDDLLCRLKERRTLSSKAVQTTGVAARCAFRKERSRSVVAGTRADLERERSQMLSKSPIGQAIGYTLSNWAALERYCEDGDLEGDNNGAERSLGGWRWGARTGGSPAATMVAGRWRS
jgi:hypothetical protein